VALFWKCVAASMVLGYLVPRFDDRGIPWLASPLGQHESVAFLQATAAGMMALTGIVFSLLVVLLQFGTTAYSPRIVAVVGRPQALGAAGGTFIGTFLYALMALRGVGALAGGATSSLIVWVAFAWLLSSVFMLTRVVRALAHMLQTNVLYHLGDAGQREIDALYRPLAPGEAADEPAARDVPPGLCERGLLGAGDQIVVYRGPPRYVIGFDAERLVALARAAGAVVYLPYSPGDAISHRATLAVVRGGRIAEDELVPAIRLARDRTLEDDPKYALRLLVDIGIHALATGVNEPTSTVLALDQIEALLTSLGNARLDIGAISDSSGALRLVFEATSWEEYLELGLAEIQHYGAASVQVQRRLAALFEFVARHVPESRRVAVEHLARHRRVTVEQVFPGLVPHAQAEPGDRQGLGHRASVVGRG
jgi:uncharacterized membrane protein